MYRVWTPELSEGHNSEVRTKVERAMTNNPVNNVKGMEQTPTALNPFKPPHFLRR